MSRLTGACYLALAIAGALGFLWVRPQLYVPGDATATARNLVEQASLGRLWVVLELGIVLTQAVTALAFYRLFYLFDAIAAGAIAAFGLVNAGAILCSAVCIAAALQVSQAVSLAPAGDVAATTQLLFEISSKFWSLGGLFFGLWLLPMGRITILSGVMPKALGWTLIAGGLGYIIGAFVPYALPQAPSWFADALALPASVGEFWMIGYLLFVGVRPVSARAAQPS